MPPAQNQKKSVLYILAVQVAPECAEAHNNLGVIHRELNNLSKALSLIPKLEFGTVWVNMHTFLDPAVVR